MAAPEPFTGTTTHTPVRHHILSVLVENKAGAGGNIGVDVVAKSAPDGYTILINSNAQAITPAMYANLPYDTQKDFIDVAPLAIQPNVLIVSPDSKFNSVQDIIAFARKNPGEFNWGHAGTGSGTHLSSEKVIAATGIKVTQIPFKGTPEVVAAVGSQVEVLFDGGIRRGSDVIKALSLGARAVLVGRAYAYGLGAAGDAGRVSVVRGRPAVRARGSRRRAGRGRPGPG